MARIGMIVIDARDVKATAAFWSAALGYEIDSESDTWIGLEDPARNAVPVGIQRTADAHADVNRVHIDLNAPDVEAEVARLERLGARRVQPWPYPKDASWVVMSDPDGNEFCVVRAAP